MDLKVQNPLVIISKQVVSNYNQRGKRFYAQMQMNKAVYPTNEDALWEYVFISRCGTEIGK
jgi:hypothetical protein